MSPEVDQPGGEWHIHLGAHRTATTHLQDTLELHQAELAAAGVSAPSRAHLRERNLGGKTLPGGLKRLLPDVVSRLRLRRLLGQLAEGRRRTVISEEKILGFVRDLLLETVYPELEDRVSMLHRALGDLPTTLYLSVRDPGTLLPSAYVQCLRMGNQGLPDFETVRRRALSHPFSWSRLVRRIQAAAPGRPLRVWTFESYTGRPAWLLGQLTGTEGIAWRDIEAPASTRGISLETIALIRALPQGIGKREYREACLRLGREDKGVRRFSPFTPEERLRLSESYREDLARLGAENPGILLDPPA